MPTNPSPTPVASPRTVFWWMIGAAFSVLVILCGAGTIVTFLAQRSDDQRQAYHHQIGKVILDVDAGDVVIDAGEADTVTIRRHLTWSWHKPTSEETWEGDTLRIRPRSGHVSIGFTGAVDYRLTVPSGTSVQVRTSTGDITVRDIVADLHTTTDAGNITLVAARAGVLARTSTGDIRATGLRSPVIDARTDAGNVTLGCAEAPARVDTAASTGDITVVVPRTGAYLVHAAAEVGDARINVAQDPAASGHIINATTNSGNVTVRYS